MVGSLAIGVVSRLGAEQAFGTHSLKRLGC